MKEEISLMFCLVVVLYCIAFFVLGMLTEQTLMQIRELRRK